MYIESVLNRSSPPAVLLRESYRDGGRVKKRTLANLSKLPTDAIQVLRRVLRNIANAAVRRRIERACRKAGYEPEEYDHGGETDRPNHR